MNRICLPYCLLTSEKAIIDPPAGAGSQTS